MKVWLCREYHESLITYRQEAFWVVRDESGQVKCLPYHKRKSEAIEFCKSQNYEIQGEKNEQTT